MTKRDFELIARVVKQVGEDGALAMDSAGDRIALAEQFADALAETNPRFDRARFVEASTFAEDREEVADPEYDAYA